MTEKQHTPEYYNDQPHYPVAIDCIIFCLHEGSLRLLLVRRDFEPCKGEWSLMGGFVRETESLQEAACRVLKSLTGIEGVSMHQIGAFGGVNRDPAERVITIGYSALLNYSDIDHSTLREYDVKWVEVSNVPELIFDHNIMIAEALKQLRRSMFNENLAFSLLPEYFTLTQLQRLFESVLGRKEDKRNFRRRALESFNISATEMIDKESSRRGARLYKFNGQKKKINNY